MTLLTAKCLVNCPRDCIEVDVKKACLGCDCLLSISYVSGLPVICCIYPKRRSIALLEAEKTERRLEKVLEV